MTCLFTDSFSVKPFFRHIHNEYIRVPRKPVSVAEQGRAGDDMHRILLAAVPVGMDSHAIARRSAKKSRSLSAFWHASTRRDCMCASMESAM